MHEPCLKGMRGCLKKERFPKTHLDTQVPDPSQLWMTSREVSMQIACHAFPSLGPIVAVSCSVLQCLAVSRGLQCLAASWRVLQCTWTCFSCISKSWSVLVVMNSDSSILLLRCNNAHCNTFSATHTTTHAATNSDLSIFLLQCNTHWQHRLQHTRELTVTHHDLLELSRIYCYTLEFPNLLPAGVCLIQCITTHDKVCWVRVMLSIRECTRAHSLCRCQCSVRMISLFIYISSEWSHYSFTWVVGMHSDIILLRTSDEYKNLLHMMTWNESK